MDSPLEPLYFINHNSNAEFVVSIPPSGASLFLQTIFNSYVSFIKPNDSNVNT